MPILDVGPLSRGGEAAARAVATTLRGHLGTVGFVHVAGHGIPEESVQAVREASRRFFALPEEEKLRIRIDRNFRGYLPINSSTDYVERMGALGRGMLGAIAASLDLGPEALDPFFEKPTTFLRLLHYPTQRQEDGLFGSAPHRAYGFTTPLSQDEVGGLEGRNEAGDRVPAPPVPGTFVMNAGDILARWSNDRVVSTPHRVINRSGRERYSQPFFFDPGMDRIIDALPTCIAPGERPRCEPVVYRDYLMERIDKTYHYRRNGAAQAASA